MSKVNVRDKIVLMDGEEMEPVPATVTCTLAVQFLAKPKGSKRTKFFFYADEGVTWERVHDTERKR